VINKMLPKGYRFESKDTAQTCAPKSSLHQASQVQSPEMEDPSEAQHYLARQQVSMVFEVSR